jgi:DNA repair exonuclease SbcCD ATPase subunit
LNHSNKKESKRDEKELEEKYQEMIESLARSQKEVKEWENKCKQINEQLKGVKSHFEKEAAIFNQKMEFQQIEISELKIKNSELN